MTASHARPIVGSRYTLGEEIANSITSGIASGLSVAALVVMVVHAALRVDGWHVTGCAIFGASLVVSNLSSTLYHAIAPPAPSACSESSTSWSASSRARTRSFTTSTCPGQHPPV